MKTIPADRSAKVAWIRKNWKYTEICNNVPGGSLVITIYNQHGNGRIFLESHIDECIDYIKSNSDPNN
jgi:hypothetical protein